MPLKTSKTELEPLEQAIEADGDAYLPIMGEKRERIQGILTHARKSRHINIRISEHDLAGIRRRAEQEGIPYQTLIASVLHRFVTDRLVDEEHVRRAARLLAG